MSEIEHPPLQHVPVLLSAALDLLQPKLGETYLDLTAGYGGHATAFLEQTQNYDNAYLVDRDENAQRALAPLKDRGAVLINQDFATAAQNLAAQGKAFDLVLVDLGVSSPQLDLANRGFSFLHDGPLDMRMDPGQTLTAETVVNTYSERHLTEIITDYGEEPKAVARRYASAIVKQRPISSTKQLAEIIVSAHRGSWQKTHPATRTFQAIRIEVNDELSQITTMLHTLPQLLNTGGRVGIISFHSLEDRLVKHYFTEQDKAGYEAELKIINKKPRDGTEDAFNPRARSAKLRAAYKT